MSTHAFTPDSKVTFGFWTYLMTDCVLFASLFAAYAVLHTNTFGGPTARELFSMPYVLVETLLLLTSSLTCGLAMLAAHRHDRNQVIMWFSITFILGLAFLGMEVKEFAHMLSEGDRPRTSAFLSSYFTLVGTHGIHIATGLIWIGAGIVNLLYRGFTAASMRSLTLLSLFWHFLDIVWIFIFTLVYLNGML